MPNRPPRTVDEWISELGTADTARRQKAIEILAALAPSSARAAKALRAIGINDIPAVRRAAQYRVPISALRSAEPVPINPAERARLVAIWLRQFRNGIGIERQMALMKLEDLGEVELF
jgi:hypothetical protein